MVNAHLRGKIELAIIGERSEQQSQLYFVPIERPVGCYLSTYTQRRTFDT